MGAGDGRRRVDRTLCTPDGGRRTAVSSRRAGVLGRAGRTTLQSQQPKRHLLQAERKPVLLPRLRTLNHVFDPSQRIHSKGETPRHVVLRFNEDMRHTLADRRRWSLFLSRPDAATYPIQRTVVSQ